jgi:CheY-like chemotaxis protein
MNRGLPILLVEDNESDVTLFKRIFAGCGIHNPLYHVRDGETAIQYLQGTGQYANREAYSFPSVIFCNSRLSKMSGLGVLQWLRNNPACCVIPTILFGVPEDKELIKEAYNLGANSVFNKPTSFQDLERTVRLMYEYWELCLKPDYPSKC